MTTRKPRPLRQQFNSRVRIIVSGKGEIAERYASNLSEGGLFIRDDEPPPVGTEVLLEFVLPDGRPLSRSAARVVHSRPAISPGDKTAGMGLQFTRFGTVAKSIIEQVDKNAPEPAALKPDPISEPEQPRLLSMRGLELPLLTASGPIIGIDLGTVNSCVATVEGGTSRIVLSPQGYDTIPSVVFLSKENELLVGHKALERMILEPDRAVYGSKRFMGRPFVSKEVQTYGHFFTFDIVAGPDGRAAAEIHGQQISLEEVAGQILLHLRTMAEAQLECDVSRAVITVPAYFGETQRQAVRDAGRLAGLQVERILNEPTAAAVAYGYGRGIQRTILVYDLGGGTFDATVLRIDNDTFEVLSTDGDSFLGGSDFDDRLTEYVLSSFERTSKRTSGHVLRGDPVAVQRIRFAVELGKRQLTEATVTDLDLPYIAHSEEGPVHLRMQLTRELLERLTGDLVDRTLGIVQTVLDRAELTTQELDDILLIGGQSRSPHVRAMLVERFKRQPSSAVQSTEAVALGAALIAEALHNDLRVHLADILPASIQLALADGKTEVLIARGARLPASKAFEVMPSQDGMDEIRVPLYRGEAGTVAGNTFLGVLIFTTSSTTTSSTEAAQRTKGDVVLKVSADGLLSVQAKNPLTGEHRELELSLTDD
ncbi:MAG: Hsp70 family protein [Myxococcota bacterium]